MVTVFNYRKRSQCFADTLSWLLAHAVHDSQHTMRIHLKSVPYLLTLTWGNLTAGQNLWHSPAKVHIKVKSESQKVVIRKGGNGGHSSPSKSEGNYQIVFRKLAVTQHKYMTQFGNKPCFIWDVWMPGNSCAIN